MIIFMIKDPLIITEIEIYQTIQTTQNFIFKQHIEIIEFFRTKKM